MSQNVVAPVASDVPRPALAQLAIMPRVDLLPPELAERNELRKLQTGCAAVVVAVAVAIGSLWLQGHQTVNDRKADLKKAQATQSSVQGQVSQLRSVQDLYDRADAAIAMRTAALAGDVRWSQQLRDLGMATPPTTVWLTSLSVSPAGGGSTAGASGPAGASGASASGDSPLYTVTIAGAALSRNDVATWLNAMSRPGSGFVNPFYTAAPLTSTKTNAADSPVTFTGTIQVTSAVLSHRYTTANTNGG